VDQDAREAGGHVGHARSSAHVKARRSAGHVKSEVGLVCDLTNGAIFNDFERTVTLFSKSHHSLTLNISQTVTDMAIVTIEGE